ncbi:MAG TPA: MFS transporter [bacterium]|nr:MFS transporter [bacterium]
MKRLMASIPVRAALRGNYFFYTFALGSMAPFLIVYFKDDLGFHDGRLGLMMMIRPAVALIAQPFWSILADTGGHRGRLAFVLAVTAGCLFPILMAARGLAFLIGLLLIWSFFNAPLNTLNDAIVFQYLGVHKRIRFAQFRIFASLGWIVSMLVIGRLFDRFGVHWLFFVYSFGVFGAAFFLWRIPPDEKATWRKGFLAVRVLLAKRNVIFFLIAVFLFEFANHMGYTFLSVYGMSLGANHVQVGWIWAVATAAEVVTMMAFPRIVRKISIKTVLLLGMLFTVVRWLPFGFMRVWWQILPLQLLHAFTLTFGYIGAATFMDMESPREIRFSAQAFYSTFILNSAAITGAFFGGQISHRWGYSWLYLTAGLFTLFAAFWLAFLVKTPHYPAHE